MTKKFLSIFLKAFFGFILLFSVLIGVPILLEYLFGSTVAIIVSFLAIILVASAVLAFTLTRYS